jgi:hypothetical protein
MANSLQDVRNNLYTGDMIIVWLVHKFGRLIKDEKWKTIKEETF